MGALLAANVASKWAATNECPNHGRDGWQPAESGPIRAMGGKLL
jgi:hypothetical protein